MAVTAVALCGTFVSCHDDEITTATIEQRKLAFEEAFVSFYGQPDPNHTWGFGNAGENVTRATINVNGNEWETRPEVTTDEKNKVFAYVNMTLAEMTAANHPYYETMPEQLVNYYVTQVYTGTDKYTTWQDKDKTPWILGSSKMNNLHIAMAADASLVVQAGQYGGQNWVCSGDWEHINNFNASDNTNYGGNTLVLGGGTYDFAYHGAEDNNYHNKWIAVKGSDIDASLSPYYYICFDHVAYPIGTKSWFKVWVNESGNQDGTQHHETRIAVEGTYGSGQALLDGNIKTVSYEGKTYTVGTDWTFDGMDNPNMCVPANEVYTDWIIRLVIAQPKNTPQLTLPKIMVPTTSGKTLKEVYTETNAVEGGRVMCEDIATQSYSRKDFDYNDVVFDAIIYKKTNVLVTTTYDNNNNVTSKVTTSRYTQVDNMPDPNYSEYYANIRVMAAGGTIPLQLTANGHNFEVHNVLGGKPTTVMINTLHKGEEEVVNKAAIDHHDPVDLRVNGSTDIEGVRHINDIAIDVKYSQASAKIDAIPGRASAKILVPLGTRWAKERTDISEAYPGFSSWVNNEFDAGNIWGASNINTSVMYDALKGLSLPANPVSRSRIWYKEESNGGAATLTDATNTTLVRPGSNETILYDYTSSKGPGYLYESSNANDGVVKVLTTDEGFSSITQGSTIRIYGVSIDNWEVFSSFNTTSAITSYAGDGYVEIQVTNPSLIERTGLLVTGKNFTITFITVINASSGGDQTGEDQTGGDQTGDDQTDNDQTDDDQTGDTVTLPVQIWPESGTAEEQSSAEIDGSKFIGIPANSTLKVYCTFGANNWFNCYMNFKDYSPTMPLASNWTSSSENKQLNATTAAKSSNGDCVEMVLSADAIAEFQLRTLVFHFGNIVVSRITIE